MALILKKSISENGIITVEMFDKTKKNCNYNYLVEFSVIGRTTPKSKTFVKIEDAEEYYKELIKPEYINII